MRRPWRRWLAAALFLLALTGCGKKTEETLPPQIEQVPVTEATIPATIPPTTPPDGDPNSVTCKGSYTGTGSADTVVARVEDAELTNGQLTAYYWAEAAAYRQSGEAPAPDFDKPLDTQVCELDESVGSWQQFFLRRALNTWHTAQALRIQGREEGLPVEEAYLPDPVKYERYMKDMPANQFLYRYEKSFRPNTMHQAWLDAIPEMLETLAAEKGYASAEAMAKEAFGTSLEALKGFVEDYNWGYMYFTNLSYYVSPSEEELEKALAELASAGEAENGNVVDIHHILLIPGESKNDAGEIVRDSAVTVAEDGKVTCGEDLWKECEAQAQALLNKWAEPKNLPTAGSFADMAFKNTRDQGTALDGGSYHGIRQGQLIPELDAWCFESGRAAGDTTIFRSPYGVHILYLAKIRPAAEAKAEEKAIADGQADLVTVARAAHPMNVDYRAITLEEGKAEVSLSDLLYPDVAHERFPEIPLYLQQDYPQTRYGAYWIRTNGCGITTMAMVASYLADDELTPPEMCARFGQYSYVHGTDGIIFLREPAGMGFYTREKTYEPTRAHAALEEGQIVVSLQQKGYWTRGGHYIALEKLLEDGTVQVRDSNIFNYMNVRSHKQDKHTWGSIVSAAAGFWIFEDKVTMIPACERCGTGEAHTTDFLQEGYICHKCAPALMRRGTYLAACGE